MPFIVVKHINNTINTSLGENPNLKNLDALSPTKKN